MTAVSGWWSLNRLKRPRSRSGNTGNGNNCSAGDLSKLRRELWRPWFSCQSYTGGSRVQTITSWDATAPLRYARFSDSTGRRGKEKEPAEKVVERCDSRGRRGGVLERRQLEEEMILKRGFRGVNLVEASPITRARGLDDGVTLMDGLAADRFAQSISSIGLARAVTNWPNEPTKRHSSFL